MKKQIKTLIYILMAISLITCCVIGVRRIQVEVGYKDVSVAVRYSDMLRISIEEEIPLEEVLSRYKQLGATTLFVKENTVAGVTDRDYTSYKGIGTVSIMEGYVLKFYYPEVEGIKPEARYIVTEDKDVADRIYENYFVKGIELERLNSNEVYFLDIDEYSTLLTVIGVGFDTEALNMAADLGYTIAPQIKNWDDITAESLDYVMDEISSIKNVETIYFSDSEVPGADSEAFTAFIEDNYQLGFIEFSSNKQEGFSTLAKATSNQEAEYKVVRLHTIEDAKLINTSIAELIDRYDLALNERNNRTFLFKLPNTTELEDDITYFDESIEAFIEEATSFGYTVTGTVPDYNLPQVSRIMLFVAGLASFLVLALLLAEVNCVTLGYVITILGILVYTALLMVKQTLGMQCGALLGSIVFPTYAMIKGLRDEPRDLKETIISFLKVCAISFGGVLTTVGVLSTTNFALGIDSFLGVKLVTTVPILLVLIYLVYSKHKLDTKYYFGLLNKQITYGALILVAILAAVLYVYISRTGNSGTTTPLELSFRQFLRNVLGVRPRTKEILIGYPILIALLYYGYKERYIIFTIFAVMGPVSLVNTYGHIHTPLLVSLLRSVYGIVIGLVVGLILIWIIKLLSRVIRKWQIQLK